VVVDGECIIAFFSMDCCVGSIALALLAFLMGMGGLTRLHRPWNEKDILHFASDPEQLNLC
jgi:hypothetical protein